MSADDRVAKLVAELLPLYSDGEQDTPDSILTRYPNQQEVVAAHALLLDVLFPAKRSSKAVTDGGLEAYLRSHLSEAYQLLEPEVCCAIPYRWTGQAACTEGWGVKVDAKEECTRVLDAFYSRIPDIRKQVIMDVEAAYNGDPAALTYGEVQLAYPGLRAVASHRLAHQLYLLDVPIIPRMFSEWTHTKTGVDINPGARIGDGFFIDHGTGVVIGETAVIGKNVKIYQGVTLGAKSFDVDENGHPVKKVNRHPTVEDDVVIYSGATILGGDTVIGRGSTIGGNVFLLESVPPGSFVVRPSETPQIKPDRRLLS